MTDAARAACPRLGRLFAPRSVALVGVPGDLSRYPGRAAPLPPAAPLSGSRVPSEPGRRTISDLPAYPALDALPERPDVAHHRPAGVPGCPGDRGLRDARYSRSRSCWAPGSRNREGGEAEDGAGLVTPRAGPAFGSSARTRWIRRRVDRVALTFSTIGGFREELRPGPVAVLSQWGRSLEILLDRATKRSLGVGLFVSTGDEASLSLADYLDSSRRGRPGARDRVPHRRREAERVRATVPAAAARGVAVVALKLGASPTGTRAARSHTGSLAGARDAWPGRRRRAFSRWTTRSPRGTNWHPRAGAGARRPHMAMATVGGVAVLVADALDRAARLARWRRRPSSACRRFLPYVAVGEPRFDITARLPDETFGEVLATVAGIRALISSSSPLTLADQRSAPRRHRRQGGAHQGRPLVVVAQPRRGALVHEGSRAHR